MYAQCLVIAQGETRPDNQMVSIRNSEGLSSLLEVERTPAFRDQIRDNEKYLGAELLPAAHTANEGLKYELASKKIDTVVVAPSAAALQTAFDIFGDREDLSIYVEPLLQQRICSTASIPTDQGELLGQFKSKPESIKVEDKNWFLAFGNAQSVDDGRSPQEYCLEQLRKNGSFESMEAYLDRNLTARKQLFDYHQKATAKVAVVAHPEMIEVLTATGWHEDGQLVNPIRFRFGEWKREHVWIEGVQGQAEETHIPICGR